MMSRISIFLIFLSLFSTLHSQALPTPPGEIYHYDNSNPKTGPVWYWFVQGPNTFSSETRIGDIHGDLKKPSPLFNLQDIKDSWTLTGILRFYGESAYDSPTNTRDRYTWDLFCDDECGDPDCSFRTSYAPHGSKKHYWRWDGIFDEEHMKSKNISQDLNHPVWKKIFYNLTSTAPDGTARVLIPKTPFTDNSVSINKQAAEFLDFSDSKDLGFTITSKNCSIVFPIPFQNCRPGIQDTSMIDEKNSYLLELKVQFPYAYWNTQLPGKYPDASTVQLSLFKTRVFVWDASPPVIKELSFPKFFTTGDPVPETMIFTVTDDNPNQEIEEIIVTIGDQTFTKSGGEITLEETRKCDLSSLENYSARCKFKFANPPDRKTALETPSDFYIAPYDFDANTPMTIEGSIEISVKHGVGAKENTLNQKNSMFTEESFMIPIFDNDPPSFEIKFAETSEELRKFLDDSTQIPTSRQACGFEISPADADFHMDLDCDQTPVRCSLIQYGSGKVVKAVVDDYTATRDPLHSPGIASEIISIDLSGKKDMKLTLIEDKRYYFAIKVYDNVSEPSEVKVYFEKQQGSTTLNLSSSSSTLVPVETSDAKGVVIHPLIFTQSMDNSPLIIRVEDRDKNTLQVALPLQVIKYSTSHSEMN